MNGHADRARSPRPLQYVALVGYLVFLGFPLLWLLVSLAASRRRSSPRIAPRLLPQDAATGRTTPTR